MRWSGWKEMPAVNSYIEYLIIRKCHYLRKIRSMALLEEVCNWGQALGFQMLKPCPVSLSFCCLWIHMLGSQLPYLPVGHHTACHEDKGLNLWKCKKWNAFLCKSCHCVFPVLEHWLRHEDIISYLHFNYIYFCFYLQVLILYEYLPNNNSTSAIEK